MASTSYSVVAFALLSISFGVPLKNIPGPSEHRQIAQRIAVAPEVNHSLLVCNAYAYTEPLDVFRTRSHVKLNDAPISYKGCSEMVVALEEGDELDFRAGPLDVGTFTATGLPKRPASLLLVPHRRDHNYMSITFESHAFSELESSQVAVIDAYRGRKDGTVTIRDAPKPRQSSWRMRDRAPQEDLEPRRTEKMDYKSIVALNPGQYQVGLVRKASPDAELLHSLNVASVPKKYVIMRVGNDDGRRDDKSNPFPEELVLFQSSSRCFRPLQAVVFVSTIIVAVSALSL